MIYLVFLLLFSCTPQIQEEVKEIIHEVEVIDDQINQDLTQELPCESMNVAPKPLTPSLKG